MKIYIVEGSTGEYSDRTDWVVCAFKSKKKAEKLVHDAMRRAKELEIDRKSRYDDVEGENEFDPNMRMDYTGTSYYVVECDLRS